GARDASIRLAAARPATIPDAFLPHLRRPRSRCGTQSRRARTPCGEAHGLHKRHAHKEAPMRHISVLSSFVVLSTFVLACSDAQPARIDAAHRDGRIDAPPPGGGSDAGATGGGYDPTHCEMDSPAAPPAASARYIMPTGQGAADGTSWANAAAMSALDAMVAAVGAGGTVYIRADAGEYVFTQDPAVLVAHGGRDRN